MKEYYDYLKDITELIYKIKRKPGIYLGHYSIIRFNAFLDGFSMGYNYPGHFTFYPDFQKYIDEKYNPKKLTENWAGILLRVAGDEGKALDKFFYEFKSFLQENNIDIPEIDQ
ncbi:MAG: hypothetical protein IJ571_09360 [Ruminococcus sp.]|nr:hypothetical protein [Ruminococcus sp.]